MTASFLIKSEMHELQNRIRSVIISLHFEKNLLHYPLTYEMLAICRDVEESMI